MVCDNSRRNTLSALLGRAVLDPLKSHTAFANITRRQFMQGAAVGGSVAAVAVLSETGRSQAVQDELKIVCNGQVWKLDLRRFSDVYVRTTSYPIPGFVDAQVVDLSLRYPGTDFVLRGKLEFLPRRNITIVRVAIRGWPIQEFKFAAWAGSIRSSDAPRVISSLFTGDIHFDSESKISASAVRMSLDSQFNLVGQATRSLADIWATPYRGSAKEFWMVASAKPSTMLVAIDPRRASSAVTLVQFREIALARATTLSRVDIYRIGLEGRAILSLEAFDRRVSGRSALLLLVARSVTLSFARGPQAAIRIKLARAAFLGFLHERKVLLAGHVARQGISTGPFSIEVGGAPEPFFEEFNIDRTKSFEFEVGLTSVHAPVADANSCEIEFRGSQARLSIGTLPGKAGPGAEPVRLAQAKARIPTEPIVVELCAPGKPEDSTEPPLPTSPHVHLGPDAFVEAPLGRAIIRLRRSVDLFDLGFRFPGQFVSIRGRETVILVPRKSPPVRWIVEFPAQHIEEEAFSLVPNDPPPPPDPTEDLEINFEKKPRWYGAPAEGAGEPKPVLARAAASGPSRLAFMVKNPAPRTPVTIETLTEWSNLSLAVHERALKADATLEDELKLLNEDQEADVSQVPREEMKKRVRNLLEKGPAPDQTALEVVTGLIFSPDDRGRFKTPGRPNPLDAEMWTAQFDPSAGSRIRAIYAKDMYLGFIDRRGASSANDPKPRWHDIPDADDLALYALSMTRRDRRQIVMMSSAVGVAAMRRLTLSGYDDPSGIVVRPDGPFAWLSDDKTDPKMLPPEYRELPPAFCEGIARPRPFDQFDLTLSARGATALMKVRFEPYAPWVDKETGIAFITEAASLQSLRQEIGNGRDLEVELVYKGFLFPLGFLAALVKLTEKNAGLPFRANPELDRPTAYNTQRLFIVATQPRRTLPGLYQPFDSRGSIIEKGDLELITVKTVDLDAPRQIRLDKAVVDNEPPNIAARQAATEKVEGGEPGYTERKIPSGRCFWPRSGHQAIAFKYLIGDNPTPATMPLIFIDNSVAHNKDEIATLVDLYNDGKFDGITANYRDSKHGGAVRRYALERTDGEASYKTIAQRIAAVGRNMGVIVQADGTTAPAKQSFEMDPYMEGQDQPPFYPMVAIAEIEVSSFDRLSGTTGGSVKVAFEETYLRHGFDRIQNPAEIYLRAVEESRDITFSGGTASGGVATPNIHFAALSRTQGLIGGGRSSANTNVPQPAPLVPNAPTQQYDIDDALNGVFDARKFFGGSLIDARLMGDIKLWDLIAATGINRAPILQEVSTIAEDATGEVVKVLKPALNRAIELTGTLKELVRDGVQGYSIAQLYPELNQALEALKAALENAKIALSGAPAEIIDAALKVAETGKALLAVLNAIAERPVPRSLEEAFDRLNSYVDIVRSLIETATNGFGIEGLLGSKGPLHAILMALAEEGLFEVWFGPGALRLVPPAADQPAHLPSEPSVPTSPTSKKTDYAPLIERFLSNPNEALQSAAQGLLFETVGRPLLQGADRLARGLSNSGKLPWSRMRLREPLLAAIGGAAGVLRLPRLETLAEDILDVVQLNLDKAFEPSDEAKRDPKVLKQELEGILHRRLASIRTAVAPLLAAFWQELGGLTASAKAALDHERSALTGAQAALDAASETERPMKEANLAQAMAKVGLSRALVEGLSALTNDGAAPTLQRIQAALALELEPAAGRILFAGAEQAKTEAERGIARLAAGAAGLFETAGALQILATAGEAAATICQDVNKVTEAATAVLTGVLANSGQIVTRVTKIRDTLKKFDPSRLPEELRRKVATAIADALAGVERLVSIVEQIERYRAWLERPAGSGNDSWQDVAGKICNKPTFVELLEPSRAMLDLRLRAVAAIGDLIGRLATALDISPDKDVVKLAAVTRADADLETTVQAIADELADLARDLTAIGAVASGSWATLVTRAGAIAAGSGDFAAVAKTLSAVAVDLDGRLASAKLQPKLADKLKDLVAVVSEVANKLTALEREFAARALQALATTAKLRTQLDASAKTAVALATKPLLDLHKGAAEQMQSLADLVNGVRPGQDATLWQELLWQLGESGRTALTAAITAIEVDLDALTNISGDYTSSSAKNLIARWGTGDVGLARAAKILGDWLASLTGNVASELVRILKEQVQAFIAELVPNKFHLGYDWDTELKAFPARDPIFSMDPSGELQGERPANDLVLTSTVDITLKPDGSLDKRAVIFKGAMRPFKVHLIGDAFDLVTLHFKGANFALDAEGETSFRASLGKVELGKLLTFLKALDKFLKVGPVKVTPLFNPPAVSVHFDTGFDQIPVGPIIFKNVYLYIDAYLPFNGSQTEFKASLGTPAKKIELHYPPYFGAAMIGVTASIGGVLGFEIAIEFGASLELDYGGFFGYGRVACGIYLLQRGSGRILEGYVLARGAGQLLCFSIVLSAEIRVRQLGDSGNMQGTATYSYSFSFGLDDIEVEVTCSHSVQGSDSGPKSANLLRFGETEAEAKARVESPSLLQQLFAAEPKSDPDYVYIKRTIPNKHLKWGAYRAHLDI